MTEFELIRRYFASQPVSRTDVLCGVGDDAALLSPPAGETLVMTSDVMVEGVHFLPDADPVALGHKVLAVNLSDLAAMGATPAWFMLNLTVPAPDEAWLTAFCQGLYGLARRYRVQLVGGDTARGPRNLAIQACGFVPAGQALTRAGARPGDRVYVTGRVGDAALALKHTLKELTLAREEIAAIVDRLERPMPRVEAGVALRTLASAAIDISDGLAADLGHILEQSQVGARLHLARLPLSPVYVSRLPQLGWAPVLGGGEDYELCFTVPTERVATVERLGPALGVEIAAVGEIVAEPGLQLLDPSGLPFELARAGHDHFSA